MASPLWAIQQAVYQRLSTDSILISLGVVVVDAVPEYTQYPYIQIGYFTENSRNSFDRAGKDVSMLLHVFSTSQGNKDLYAIRDAIDNQLDRKRGAEALDLGDVHQSVDCHMEYCDVFEETSDTVGVRHMTLRYRILTVEK